MFYLPAVRTVCAGSGLRLCSQVMAISQVTIATSLPASTVTQSNVMPPPRKKAAMEKCM